MRTANSAAYLSYRPQQRATTATTGGLWWATVFLISIALPSEFWVTVGGLVLPPYRIVCIAGSLVLLARQTARAGLKWTVADLFILFLAIWEPICHLVNDSGATAWQSAGSAAIDCGAYLIARFTVRDVAALTHVAKVLTTIVFIILPFTFFEAVTQQHIVHEMIGTKLPATVFDIRLGLLRAMGPFEHAILYGTFCASALSLSWFLLPRGRRVLRTIAIGVAVLVSVSTGPMATGGLQVAFALWDRVLERVRSRWTILIFGVVLGLLVISLASNRPLINVVISYLSLVPETGWTRLAQWNFGWANVTQNWLFGLGYRDWIRPHWLHASIDSYWLRDAVMYGLPGFYGSIAATVSAVVAVGMTKIPENALRLQEARKAWMFSIVAIAIMGITVDYWHQMNAYYFFVLGLGLWLTEASKPRQAEPAGVR